MTNYFLNILKYYVCKYVKIGLRNSNAIAIFMAVICVMVAILVHISYTTIGTSQVSSKSMSSLSIT